LVLFPEVRYTFKKIVIEAYRTFCKHQINDETSRTALHPVEILWDALVK